MRRSGAVNGDQRETDFKREPDHSPTCEASARIGLICVSSTQCYAGLGKGKKFPGEEEG